jgi:RNA polymerase sigma-70 factor, ECF subfamily
MNSARLAAQPLLNENEAQTHKLAPSRSGFDAQLPALRIRLLRHAKLAVFDLALAEDLVQETLLAVFEQQLSHRGQASLKTWGTAILKNKIADWYRSPQRGRFVQPVEEDADTALAGQDEDLYDESGHYAEKVPSWQQPENHLEHRQMLAILEQCVQCLPRQTGRVLMMREWLGFESAEICSRLSLSAENCRMILHRARTGLRACMQRKLLGSKAD